MRKKNMCILGADITSVAGWTGSCGGGPSEIQHGILATETCIQRQFRLFKTYDMPTSFFISGQSLETFPREILMSGDAGHDVGADV